ncbi:MAG: LD-carboxypeptidase [Thermoanaerobaculaceae bacterium]|nr:LD-carboxypeptidase [Thermoanaerobaculaceae bacterium]
MKNRKIRVVSPSSPCDLKKIVKSKEFVENMGFDVELSENIGAKKRYLAGSDEERLKDLVTALKDKSVDILWMSRGGYGSARLLEKLNNIDAVSSKMLIGYSDSTALFCWAIKKKNLKILYAPSFSELCDKRNYDVNSLLNSIYEKPLRIKCKGPSKKNKEIKIVGGCLSILASLMGTPHFPEIEGKYLLFEDINEPMYKLDRMFMQLKLGGIFQKAEGVILGSFSNIEGGNYRSIVSLLRDFMGNEKPLIINSKIGHCPGKITLPFNVSAEWDGEKLCFFS